MIPINGIKFRCIIIEKKINLSHGIENPSLVDARQSKLLNGINYSNYASLAGAVKFLRVFRES